MALSKTNIGTKPDGTILWLYQQDDPNVPVVITGPDSRGTVTTTDGTTYDISDDVIEVASDAHAGEVAHLIGMKFEAEGHPRHTDGTPFVHECSDTCPTSSRKG